MLKKYLILSILFFGISFVAFAQTYEEGEALRLEKEAQYFDTRAASVKNKQESDRYKDIAKQKYQEAKDLRKSVATQVEEPKKMQFELGIKSQKFNWSSDIFLRNQALGFNRQIFALDQSGLLSNVNSISTNTGINYLNLNSTRTIYSDQDKNERTGFPIFFNFLNANKTFGIEMSYLQLRITPVYLGYNFSAPTYTAIPGRQATYFNPLYKRTEGELNFAYYFQKGDTYIGPAIGARMFRIQAQDFGNQRGDYGYGSTNTSMNSYGPQAGLRFKKMISEYLTFYMNVDSFRTIGNMQIQNDSTINRGSQVYTLSMKTTDSIRENVIHRKGYEVDLGFSFLRTSYFKYYGGFSYTESVVQVDGYNYNMTMTSADLATTATLNTTLNTVSKPIDLLYSRQIYSNQYKDRLSGFYFGVSLVL